MSGGHFDYTQYRFSQVADDIDELIEKNGVPQKDCGFVWRYDYGEKTIERFREAALAVRRAAEMVNRVDWLVSGDDGEESFHKRWESAGLHKEGADND